MRWKPSGFAALDCWFEKAARVGTLVGWLFLETKTCWTSGLGRFFSPSKSRFGADSENECEEKETDYKERDWQMREREKKKTERKGSRGWTG